MSGDNEENAARATQATQSPKGNEPSQSQVDDQPVAHGFVPNPDASQPRSENRKLTFLDNYCTQWTITHTCLASRVGRKTFYEWMKNDASFAAAFEIVDASVTDRFKRVAMRRADRGSDNLLMFMLKYRDPGFRDRVQAEIDPKQIEQIVNTLVDALRKFIPDNCPHCKNNLNLTNKVANMLEGLSNGV